MSTLDRETNEFHDREMAQRNGGFRGVLGKVGPVETMDLLVPVLVARYYNAPLPLVFIGQTLLHWQLGIESFFTYWLLPSSMFRR